MKKIIALVLAMTFLFSFSLPINANTVIWSDNMDDGDVSDWTYDGLWHLADSNSNYQNSHSSPNSFWYGNESNGNYDDNGNSNSGSLTTPSTDISSVSSAYIEFWSWYETETTGTSADQRWVKISTDGNTFSDLGQLSGDTMDTWVKWNFNISSYTGGSIWIRFFFDTTDDVDNGYRGWYIDDVSVNEGNMPMHIIKLSGTNAKDIQPNSTVNYTITVENKGDYDEYVYLSLSSVASGWNAELNETEFQLNMGQSKNVNLTITSPSNSKHGDSMTVSLYAENSDNSTNYQMEITTTVKMDSGGPDIFGHKWRLASYSWEEISSTGTKISPIGNSWDDDYDNVSLPFTFLYYNNSYNYVEISTNGFLGFSDDGMTSYDGYLLDPEVDPNNTIAICWDDLQSDGSSSSAIFYKYISTSPRRFIIEYYNVYFVGYQSNKITFEAILYQGGNIIFQYKDMYGNSEHDFGSTATVGIDNKTATDGLIYANNTPYLQNITAVKFFINKIPTATIDSITPNPADRKQQVDFDGHGTDSDGNIIEYEWKSNISGFLSNISSFSNSSLPSGTHNITFRVKDNDFEWSNYTYRILTINPNKKPTATIDNITPNPAFQGELIYFNGHGTDIDGNITEYEWYSSIDNYLSNSSNFNTSSLSVGTHNISFKVKDDLGDWSSYAYRDLTIKTNQKPTAYIDNIEPNPQNEGQKVNFTGHGTDNDGNVVSYEWTSDKVIGVLSNSANFSTSSLPVGTHTIKFRVQDNNGAWSNYVSQTLVINAKNKKPSAIIDSINPNPAKEGDSVSFVGHGTDSDGNVVEYQWKSSIDGILNTESSFINSSLSIGTHDISFRVKDDDGEWSDYTYSTLNIVANQQPSITKLTSSKTDAKIGNSITFFATANDTDGSITNYFFDFGDGQNSSWLTTNSTSHAYANEGIYTVKVKAKDNDNAESYFATIQITISKNKSPIINSITASKKTVQVDEEITLTVLAEDEDGKVSWYLFDFGDEEKTNWRSDNETTHSYSSEGTYTITVKVKDNEGAITEDTITIKVNKKAESSKGGFLPFIEFALLIALILVVAIVKRKKK